MQIQQPSYHVHGAPFGHFFSVMTVQERIVTLGSLGCSFVRSVVYYTAATIFELGKETILSVYTVAKATLQAIVRSALVTNLTVRCVTFFTKDLGFSEKIAILRQDIQRKTATPLYSELERVLTSLAMSSLKHLLQQAKTIEPTVLPNWIKNGILDKGEYSFYGKVSLTLFEKHEALIEKVLSHAILKIISNLTDEVQKAQSSNQFAVLDLILSVFDKVPAHFYECHGRESAENVDGFEQQDPQRQKKLKGDFYSVLANAIMQMGLPNGAKDLELPFSKTITSYLSVSLFNALKNGLLPMALKKGFKALSTPLFKNSSLARLFDVMHKAIDEEKELTDDQETHYPRIKELSTALHECFRSFFEYTDPTFLPWIVSNFVPYKIAAALAKTMTEKLESKTLQDLLATSIVKFLPKINPGGTWQEVDGARKFQMAPWQFVKTTDQRDAKIAIKTAKNLEKEIKIRKLVAEIGRDPKGLVQLMQSRIFAASTPSLHTEVVNVKSGFFSSIAGALGGAYQAATDKVVRGSLWLTDITRRIQNLNQAILQKMTQASHELLFYDIASCAIAIFGKNCNFPDLRDARFKKVEE